MIETREDSTESGSARPAVEDRGAGGPAVAGEPFGLGEALLRRLGSQRSRIRLLKGQTVFHEGMPVAGVFSVISGKVKLFKTGPEGKRYMLGIAVPGDLLGLESLFGEGPMSCSAEAAETVTVCPVEGRRARELLSRDRGLRRRALEELASRLRAADQNRLELAQAHVAERMARLLTSLAADHGVPEGQGVRIGLRLSRDDLAASIGTAQETAIRQLRSFQESRLIDLRGRSITVLDCDRLGRRAYPG